MADLEIGKSYKNAAFTSVFAALFYPFISVGLEALKSGTPFGLDQVVDRIWPETIVFVAIFAAIQFGFTAFVRWRSKATDLSDPS